MKRKGFFKKICRRVQRMRRRLGLLIPAPPAHFQVDLGRKR